MAGREKGTYKNNPGETMVICEYEGCGDSFHHNGIGPHQRFCKERTPKERGEWKETRGKYHWHRLRGQNHMVKLPARINLMTSAAPTRKLKRALPAPQEHTVIEDTRIGFSVTFEKDGLKEALAKILQSVKIAMN